MIYRQALGPAFSAFCGKLHGLWGRLCLILSQVDPEHGTFVVGERTAAAATTLVFKSILPNAARVYTCMGGSGGDIEATRSIAAYILTKARERVLASELSRDVRACRAQPLEEIKKFVSPLVAGGWCTPDDEHSPRGWIVHAEVHHHFALRASKEAAKRAAIRELFRGDTEA